MYIQIGKSVKEGWIERWLTNSDEDTTYVTEPTTDGTLILSGTAGYGGINFNHLLVDQLVSAGNGVLFETYFKDNINVVAHMAEQHGRLDDLVIWDVTDSEDQKYLMSVAKLMEYIIARKIIVLVVPEQDSDSGATRYAHERLLIALHDVGKVKAHPFDVITTSYQGLFAFLRRGKFLHAHRDLRLVMNVNDRGYLNDPALIEFLKTDPLVILFGSPHMESLLCYPEAQELRPGEVFMGSAKNLHVNVKSNNRIALDRYEMPDVIEVDLTNKKIYG